MAIGDEDLRRLESKVDRLTEAITTLVRLEERQATQGQRLGNLEERVTAAEATLLSVDRKLEQWVNRGIGLWSFAVVAWTLYLALKGA